MDLPTASSADQSVRSRPLRWYRRRWVIAVGVAVIILAGGLAYWRVTVARTMPQFTDFGIDDDSGSQLRDQLLAATKRVKSAWHDDAYPIVVSLMFEGNKASEQTRPIVYFSSPTDLNNDFFVEFSPDLKSIGTSASEPKEQMQPLVGRQALTPDNWPIGYNEILRTAEENGGCQFRKAHPKAQIIMELSNTQGIGSEWAVYYADRDEELNISKLTVFINSITGQVNEKKS
ncbi:MAG: hypothetical protein WC734_04985 [Patescibacteria group bacterium]